eukprot:m.88599 g.88599  ORF g.88599 m.88599 type:complete len:95 (+) comp14545_c1_seq3:964-1248(+)
MAKARKELKLHLPCDGIIHAYKDQVEYSAVDDKKKIIKIKPVIHPSLKCHLMFSSEGSEVSLACCCSVLVKLSSSSASPSLLLLLLPILLLRMQ